MRRPKRAIDRRLAKPASAWRLAAVGGACIGACVFLFGPLLGGAAGRAIRSFLPTELLLGTSGGDAIVVIGGFGALVGGAIGIVLNSVVSGWRQASRVEARRAAKRQPEADPPRDL